MVYIAILSLMLSVTASALSYVPVSSIEEIRNLPPEHAEKALPVKIEGQIVWKNPEQGSFFLRSGERCIFVMRPAGNLDPDRFSAGQLVEVEGVTRKGEFTPSILAETISVRGRAQRPEGRPFYAFETFSPMNDADWISIKGRLVSMRRITGGEMIYDCMVLDLEFHNALLSVLLPWSEAAENRVKELMFSRVQFNAVAGTQYNTDRQLVGRTLHVDSAEDFKVIDNRHGEKGRVPRPIHELARSGVDLRYPVMTYGTVTAIGENQIFLRGEKACLKATVREIPEVRVGDMVELEGFARHGPISPSFLARRIRKIESEKAPEPVPMLLDAALRQRWDTWPDAYLNYELVQLEAEVVDISESFGLATGLIEHTLVCRLDKHLFTVKLPSEFPNMNALKAGAEVRVTGICNLLRSTERQWRLYVDWFWIQPRNAGDIEILAPAPWWTAERLILVLGILGGAFVLILIWTNMLRRTVTRQTAVIAEKIEQESVLNERQRVARELHDNLEQGLTGSILQLGGCRRLQKMGFEKHAGLIRQALECDRADEQKEYLRKLELELAADSIRNKKALKVVEDILKFCSNESRLSILDLRGGLLEKMNLVEAVQLTLEKIREEQGIHCDLSVTGEMCRLQHVAERNLLLLIREAVSNAVRHAEPDTIHVMLDFTDGLTVSIADDGCGFPVEQGGKYGHFGLQGMQERMSRIKGTLKIVSTVGSGTVVTGRLDSLKEWKK
ncbi:sensor histidine kinase [Verrucomicrobia bacterium S94]|nr:sensor histidine kinase [Verrucomicrobia bacterium S94]